MNMIDALKQKLANEPNAIAACCDPDANVLVLTSAAYGGGGQEGEALLQEMSLLGCVVKLAALHGKEITILPQESSASC